MQRQVVTISRGLWGEVEHNWYVDFGGQVSGVSQASSTKVVRNQFPRFRGTPKFILVKSQIAQWRAVMSQAEGHLGIYRVPMFDPQLFKRATPTVPLSNGVTMTTGFFAENTPTVIAYGDHAKGATSVTIDVQAGSQAPKQGQILSHGLDWPFVVRFADEDSSVADRYTLGVSPPLRDSISDGEEIRLEAIGRFEITSDQGFPSYGPLGAVRAEITLQEVLTRD